MLLRPSAGPASRIFRRNAIRAAGSGRAASRPWTTRGCRSGRGRSRRARHTRRRPCRARSGAPSPAPEMLPQRLRDVALVLGLVEDHRLVIQVATVLPAFSTSSPECWRASPRAWCDRTACCCGGSSAGAGTGRSPARSGRTGPSRPGFLVFTSPTRWPATTRRCDRPRAGRPRSAGSGRWPPRGMLSKPQPVVGMEEDQVGFDTQRLQIARRASPDGGRTPG